MHVANTRKVKPGCEEAFFHQSTTALEPPRWKMAVITWLGVWPMVFCISLLGGALAAFRLALLAGCGRGGHGSGGRPYLNRHAFFDTLVPALAGDLHGQFS